MPNLEDKDAIFRKIADEKGITVKHDTHYDACNYQFEKWDGLKLQRVDFQPLESGIIRVTHYTDAFTCLPKLLRWCHNNLPMFPYLAEIKYKTVCDFDSRLGNTEFEQKVLSIIETTL
jgi:hypothetical protein